LTTIFEIDDEALASARAAVRHLSPDQLAVFFAQAIQRATENEPVWLPILTCPDQPMTIEVRGLLHPEANTPGRFEPTHWRHPHEQVYP
jgi:hypothetical protein